MKIINRIAVITRLHYPENDARFEHRLELYRKYTLPSLLAQLDSDFDIWVWAEPWHEAQVKALHPRINVLRGDWTPRAKQGKYFIDYTPWSKISGMPAYHIQLGLDSDDTVSPELIAKIREVCVGTKRTAVSVLPIKVDLATGKQYRMRHYRGERCAPIFALYQPETLPNGYMFAYQYGHMSLASYCDNKIELPIGYAFMHIHGENESTRIGDLGDVPL